MSHEYARTVRKLVVAVPLENIRTHSPGGTLPAYVSVSQDVLYEVIGYVDADRTITTLRPELVRITPPAETV